MLILKIIENSTMNSVQELHLCIFSTELHSMELHSIKDISHIFASSTFLVHSSTNYQLIFFCTYSFHSLNIHQHHMIYHIHTRNYQDSKQTLCRIQLYELIICIQTCIYHYSNVVYYYKRFHLTYIYTYTFHAILCVFFHQFLTLY